MDWWAWILTGVGAVVCVLLLMLGEGILRGLTEPAKDSMFRRPEFACRRSQHRGLLKSGGFCIIAAEVPVLFAITAGTSGDSADANDAWIFGWVAVALVAVGVILLALWWRLAGRAGRY